MNKELKPCPFCGKQAYAMAIPENTPAENASHPKWSWNNPGKWVVGCFSEMCMGNINHMSMIFVDEQGAVEAWNKRAQF